MKKTLLRIIEIGIKTILLEERSDSTLNTAWTSGDLQNRIKRVSDRKLLREDIKGRRFLPNQLNVIPDEGRPG